MENHESANTIPDYGKSAMDNLRFKTIIATSLGIITAVLFATIAMIEGQGSIFEDFALVTFICCYLITLPCLIKYDMKHKLCKCLAGLELGVYHSEDDLVILMGLRRKLARAMINGEFDYLITDKDFCRFIGTNRVEIVKPKQ